ATAAPQEDPYRIPLEGEDAAAVVVFDQAALDAKVADILPRLETIRGWKFLHPVAAGIQSVADFTKYANESMDEEWGPEVMEGKMASAILFGFLPDDNDFMETMRALLEAAVGGYYDPKQSKFWLIEGYAGGPLADILMAHELQHALDDQYFPLEAMLDSSEDNSDVVFALRSVVEGSATSAMNLYLVRAMTNDWLPPGELMPADMIGTQMAALDDAPLAMVAGLMLPYMEGNLFLVRGGTMLEAVTKNPSDEDLRRAFTEPPQSSEQILHPEKYWDPKLTDPPLAVVVTDRSAELGGDWRCVDEDTLGELGCAFLAVPRLPTPLELQFGAMGLRHPASAGWGGDRYRSYLREDGARLAHAITVWDTEADAEEFEAALAIAHARAPYLREVRRDGARVELFLADDAARTSLQRMLKR
ncbi:MAG: hypothetical protein O3A20_04970, partial [Planctomycetota bacterium]|nr:hypothetical protein [Planctomycetota bacterium]